MFGSDRNGFEPAALDMWQHGLYWIEHQTYLSTDEVLYSRCAASVWYMRDGRPCLCLEALACKVSGRTVARSTKIERLCIGLVLGFGNEARHAVDRFCRIGDDRNRSKTDKRNRSEGSDRIERKIFIDARIDRLSPDCTQKKDIAVGCGFGHGVRGDRSTRAPAIIDYYG